MIKKSFNNTLLFISLFSSSATLFCCALPALFVTLGAGATFASLTSTIPYIVWLTEYKSGLFVFSGIALFISRSIKLYNNKACDTPFQNTCLQTREFTTTIWKISLLLYTIGIIFAYVLPHILKFTD